MFDFKTFSQNIFNFEEKYSSDINSETFFGFPMKAILEIEQSLLSKVEKNTAYFSMEYGLAPSIYNSLYLTGDMDPKNQFFSHDVFSNYWLCDYLFKIKINKMLDIPIYGGGLGVLAGDTIKSAADEGMKFVGIGILWNKGYFKQKFWYKHGQIPEQLSWNPYRYPGLIPLNQTVVINTTDGNLHLRLWKYYVYSYDQKNVCPLILLDSNLEENGPKFRALTDQLYRSDDVWWKIFQRAILGIGGMKALKVLGYNIDCYHLNEGHAAFALVEEFVAPSKENDLNELQKKFVYTCHTPVEAGHDRFNIKDVADVLDEKYATVAESFGKEGEESGQINLTLMCLNNSNHVNAVAQKHGEIMRLQFPDFEEKIQAITNGIHVPTWISQSFEELFDKYRPTFGDWRKNQDNLKKVLELKNNLMFRSDLFEAHQINKRKLAEVLYRWQIQENVLTLGWARRIAGYKRPSLIFHDIEQVLELAYNKGPLQIILAGKAHPNDDIGSAHIDEILDHIDQLNKHKKVVKVLILENYDTYFGKLLTSSVDVWLNNPLPPFEASGTSGMKAILNGVVQLTTLDGWVVEAANDDVGWIFGYQHSGAEIGNEQDSRIEEDSQALYRTLENVVDLYYKTNRDGEVDTASNWIDKMIHCIQRSAFFNTNRMVQEYHQKMWRKNATVS